MATEMIPVTVLTGFLGSGKTTLLKRILNEFHGRRIAVIENEFGPESIDNELLVQDTEEEIIELNNGCVCCTVRGDLQRTLLDLKARREKGELQFERVMIETTGVANPGPVCQTFFIDEEVASYYMLDAVLTVVDAKHGMETLDTQPEAQQQVGFADRILVSKLDLVSDAEYQALRQRLIKMNPRAKITPVNFGEVDLHSILDITGFNLNSVLEIDPDFLKKDDHECGPGCNHEHHHHEHHHDHQCDEHCHHDHHHAHHDDEIGAFLFTSDRPFDPVKLDDFLSGLVQVYGPDLYRYKGILYLKGAPVRYLLQGVHMILGTNPGKPWASKEQKQTKIVFIGRKLPQEIFQQGLMQCLA
ncbi:CobW family GTP-binding protein [Pelistega ratti]|nr:GTP-binding protein [Pelistega ratti]